MCLYVQMCVCASVHACVSLLSSFGEEDDQRSKVTAHKAALKVIRVIPALGSSCSFPLPRTHWMRCTCTSDMVQHTVNSRLLTAFFYPVPVVHHCHSYTLTAYFFCHVCRLGRIWKKKLFRAKKVLVEVFLWSMEILRYNVLKWLQIDNSW